MARVLPILLIAVGVLILGTGVAKALDVEVDADFGSGPDEVETGAVSGAIPDLRAAERARVRRLLRAPVVLGVKRKKLDSIAECESHGDPRAVSSDGTYRGKYQFDKSTWKSNGGSGKDPAKASELEQDLIAASLYRIRGSSPWPNCG